MDAFDVPGPNHWTVVNACLSSSAPGAERKSRARMEAFPTLRPIFLYRTIVPAGSISRYEDCEPSEYTWMMASGRDWARERAS